MDRDEAKRIERDIRRFLSDGGDADDLFGRIDHGLATSDDPGVIGMLMLGRTLARQMSADPAELGAEALAASELLDEAGEVNAALFAEAVGGALLHRAGDVDAAAHIAVRSLAAFERMPADSEWGSRIAHCLALLFGELHAFELAARSSAASLAWEGARNDPMTRLTIETVRGYFAVRAAEAHPANSAARHTCVDMVQPSIEGLQELGTPAADVARNGLEMELAFLHGTNPEPSELEVVEPLYQHCAAPWIAWHELVHGRALNAAGRHDEAIVKLRSSLEKQWSFGQLPARRELVRSLTAIGRTEEALAEMQAVLDDLDGFVRSHVARQATDLADQVEAEKHSAELRLHSEQLADQVAHDHLTGLASRRALDENLDQPVDGNVVHAVLVCDLDHFKLINDAYGHEVGDEVLVHIGRLFREHTRSDDLAGRFGGEEFVVITKVDDDAAAAAERLRVAVESTRWEVIADDLRVTVSIGVAAGTAPLRDLLRAADIAMYEAKAGGRNRVRLASADQVSSGDGAAGGGPTISGSGSPTTDSSLPG